MKKRETPYLNEKDGRITLPAVVDIGNAEKSQDFGPISNSCGQNRPNGRSWVCFRHTAIWFVKSFTAKGFSKNQNFFALARRLKKGINNGGQLFEPLVWNLVSTSKNSEFSCEIKFKTRFIFRILRIRWTHSVSINIRRVHSNFKRNLAAFLRFWSPVARGRRKAGWMEGRRTGAISRVFNVILCGARE